MSPSILLLIPHAGPEDPRVVPLCNCMDFMSSKQQHVIDRLNFLLCGVLASGKYSNKFALESTPLLDMSGTNLLVIASHLFVRPWNPSHFVYKQQLCDRRLNCRIIWISTTLDKGDRIKKPTS